MRKDGIGHLGARHVDASCIDATRRAVWQGLIQDITERKARRTGARASAEERLRTLVEQLPAVIYIDAADEIATAVYVSPQYERLTGYTPAERLADPEMWMRMIHPDDRDRVVAESNRTNETGEDYDIEHRIVRRDGQVAVGARPRVPRPIAPDEHERVAGRAHRHHRPQAAPRRPCRAGTASSRPPAMPPSGSCGRRRGATCIDDVLGRLGQAARRHARRRLRERRGCVGHCTWRSGTRWLADDAPTTLGRVTVDPYAYGDGYATVGGGARRTAG